jgi:UDP-2-acetamido-3-amino-2,3-dideoxy-glucuronate N-acetyltransferase
MGTYFAHETAVVDLPCEIGEGTKIWHFSHVMKNAKIGRNCILGQNVHIANNVIIGDFVKIQNNVSLFTGIELGDYVFCGPSCVFTNVLNPRAEINRHDEYKRTVVKRGVSFGANCTIICGVEIGYYAFVGAGAVLLPKNVPDYALMVGVPAKRVGWMGRHGFQLKELSKDRLVCPESGWKYEKISENEIRCLDWPEDKPLDA